MSAQQVASAVPVALHPRLAASLRQVYRDGLVLIRENKAYWMSPHVIAGLVTRSRLSGQQVLAEAFNKGWALPTQHQASYIANAITHGEAFLVRRGSMAIGGVRYAHQVAGSRLVILKARIYMIPLQ